MKRLMPTGGKCLASFVNVITEGTLPPGGPGKFAGFKSHPVCHMDKGSSSLKRSL